MKRRYEARQLEEWEIRLHEELYLVHVDQQHWFCIVQCSVFEEDLVLPIQ